ncbi:MAG: hypothetical protein ABFS10_09875 [Bacteroidota bacterium]
MKTIISAILFTTLLFTSCGSNKSNEKDKSVDASEQSTDESAKSDDSEKAKTCEEYIDQYEEWTDNYIKLVEKYMKNPMDSELSEEFMTLSQEGALWMERWSGELVDCASQEKYQKRVDEISEKAEKKLEELGIE